MSEKKSKLNRRQALGLGAAGVVGANVGMNMMNMAGALMPQIGPFDKLRKILATGDKQAFAQAITPADHPVIQICVIDKFQQALFLQTSGAQTALDNGDLNGLDGLDQNAAALQYNGADISGMALPANYGGYSWRGMPLTPLFGQILASSLNNANYNVAVLPKWNSQAGGHSLQNSDLDMDVGGLNYVIEKNAESTGMLGAVGFSIRADANNSRDSFVSPGRIPMKTFDSVGQVRTNLKNSVAALSEPGSKAYFMRKKLDQLASVYDETIDQLQIIRELVDPALQPLLDAVNAPDIVKLPADCGQVPQSFERHQLPVRLT